MTRALIVLVWLAAPAAASTVIALSPAELTAGAERVVEGRVVSRTVCWDATHTGLETHAVIAVEATRKGAAVATLEIVVPGGELDGNRHVVFGTPAIVVGERARWFLRARPDGTYHVYGWAQGKWPVAGKTFAPAPSAEFTTNGMVWPAAKIPVAYKVNNTGSQDVSLADEIAAIDAAFATWQAVPTASLAFVNAGMTDTGLAIDDENVILFVESGWQFGSEAAAATSLRTIDGMQSADIAVNGQNFTWAISPPGEAIASNQLDLQAVLTHEIGHFSGMGHSMRSYDTMYFSWKPWQSQRTLSIDDKLGLSSLYPTSGDECGACPAEEHCAQHPLGKLCEGTPDPIGAACNYNRVECDAFCLFTAIDLSTGYCSKFCDTDTDCPLTHHCADASAGSQTVKVCFLGAQPPPVPDCTDDAGCDAGQFCAAGACTLECRAADDCGAGATCDDHGRCVSAPEDTGCQATKSSPAWLVLLLAMAAWCRSSRTTSRRPRSR